MRLHKTVRLATILIGTLLFTNCENTEAVINIPNGEMALPNEEPTTNPELSSEIKVYEAGLIDESLVLAIENGQDIAYLVNKQGQKLFTWNLQNKLGNDFELLENGQALGAFKVTDPPFSFGGFAGSTKIINPDSSIDWEYTLADDTYITHHDVELLPNGNILMMVWERIEAIVAQEAGVNTSVDIFPEKLIEVDRNSKEIVWEWRSWDHLVQDTNPNALNFGVISEVPSRIDHNYNNPEELNGDIIHANGIDYDPNKDIIYMSCNFYGEIWVIDHSTTIIESAGSSGGTYGKGGDLLYRFGNPETYQNMKGERLFFFNHCPTIIKSGDPGAGNILVYGNSGMDGLQQSTVYELKIPADLNLTPSMDNEPNLIWSFTDENLFNERISGAVRLPNGNTLICEGDYGYWEVTNSGQIAWKYNPVGNFWRGYSYKYDFPGLKALNINL